MEKSTEMFATSLLLPASSNDKKIQNKYKRFKRSKVKAVQWLRWVCDQYPNLFYHWVLGYQLT